MSFKPFKFDLILPIYRVGYCSVYNLRPQPTEIHVLFDLFFE
jgi:hypothetical protein